MARIDRILSLVADAGANELRLGTDREPQMLAYGTVKRLSIPMTSEETLRDLLGEILTPEREAVVRSRGRIDMAYEATGLGTFQVTLTSRAEGFDVVFRRSSAPLAQPATAVAGSAPSAPLPPPPTSTSVAAAIPLASPPSYRMEVSPPLAATVAAPSDALPLPMYGALSELVAHAIALRASDLHLSDGEPPAIRVDGKLQRLDHPAIALATVVPLDESTEARFRMQSSVDFGLEVPDAGRVRVHVFRSDTGRAASIRLLPRVAPSLASLNLPIPLEDLIELPHGLVLLCGASGSGKSTTLAALAQEALRRRSVVLVTLEDPIEYALVAPETAVLRRRQIGRDAPDFASGLRDALRQDPDLILIGEMRDPETISLALTAAETGHLVLASLHSRSATSAVERIVDAYPPERASQVRTQLADSLRAIVAQRLLPRTRGTGRIPVIEVLRSTHAIASLIREGKTAQIGSAIQSGRLEGMITLERCLANRVIAGEIRLESARAAANDPAALAMHLPK